MNGVHDMGGMDGFGKVEPEPNEPMFHTEWEARVLAACAGPSSGRTARAQSLPDRVVRAVSGASQD